MPGRRTRLATFAAPQREAVATLEAADGTVWKLERVRHPVAFLADKGPEAEIGALEELVLTRDVSGAPSPLPAESLPCPARLASLGLEPAPDWPAPSDICRTRDGRTLVRVRRHPLETGDAEPPDAPADAVLFEMLGEMRSAMAGLASSVEGSSGGWTDDPNLADLAEEAEDVAAALAMAAEQLGAALGRLGPTDRERVAVAVAWVVEAARRCGVLQRLVRDAVPLGHAEKAKAAGRTRARQRRDLNERYAREVAAHLRRGSPLKNALLDAAAAFPELRGLDTEALKKRCQRGRRAIEQKRRIWGR